MYIWRKKASSSSSSMGCQMSTNPSLDVCCDGGLHKILKWKTGLEKIIQIYFKWTLTVVFDTVFVQSVIIHTF